MNTMEEGLENLDNLGLAALKELSDLQALGQVLLHVERKRLSRELGRDDPRVRYLEERAKKSLELINELGVELEVRKINVPEVEEREALIHGRVVDSHNRGVGGLIVQAEDSVGAWLRTIGNSETAASGYFALTITDAKIRSLRKRHALEVYLIVRTKKGSVVWRRSGGIDLVEGLRHLENIMLVRQGPLPGRNA